MSGPRYRATLTVELEDSTSYAVQVDAVHEDPARAAVAAFDAARAALDTLEPAAGWGAVDEPAASGAALLFPEGSPLAGFTVMLDGTMLPDAVRIMAGGGGKSTTPASVPPEEPTAEQDGDDTPSDPTSGGSALGAYRSVGGTAGLFVGPLGAGGLLTDLGDRIAVALGITPDRRTPADPTEPACPCLLCEHNRRAGAKCKPKPASVLPRRTYKPPSTPSDTPWHPPEPPPPRPPRLTPRARRRGIRGGVGVRSSTRRVTSCEPSCVAAPSPTSTGMTC